MDFVDAIYQIFEQRLQREAKDLSVEKISNLIDVVIANYQRYEVDSAIYGDLDLKFKELKKTLN